MGRVRTKTVKRASRQIVEKHYSLLTYDFQLNKKIADDVAEIPTKRLRNKIAGYTTHLMKRIRTGPVRGISLKLQEQEREARLERIPDESALVTSKVEVDKATAEMLTSIGLDLPEVTVSERRRAARGPRRQQQQQ